MKQFISNIKNLSQKAADLKAAMQQVPPKVAEIRQAVASTAGQLQQLRLDVQSTVAGLKADNEQHLSQAMQEINGSVDVFMEAGFELGGMDLELSPVQRLLVHLDRLEEVHPSRLRSLISSNQHRRTTQAILASMLQAQEMADTVELGELSRFSYRELIVGIGPIPSLRMCWRIEAAEPAEEVARPAAPPAAPPTVAAPPATPQSFFGQSSFFEKQAAPAQPTAMGPALPSSAPTATPIRVDLPKGTLPPAENVPSEKPDPLARFKKMPQLAKYQ